MGACGETRNTVINFQLDGITEGMHPVLTVGGESFELIPDSLGFVSFYAEGLDKPQDGMLECGNTVCCCMFNRKKVLMFMLI